MNKQDVELLSKEIEMLMAERGKLLKVVGAAAVLIANTSSGSLPVSAVGAADMLSEAINNLRDETLKDALESVQAKVG